MILGICVAVELALLLGDHGILDIPRLRQRVYYGGGFFAGLLQGWRPNFAAQPVTMFVTYAFVHAGVVHLVLNMITLVIAGRLVVERVGELRFLAIYATSAIGGALAFGFLGPILVPMVGASGALFGLAGAVVAWGWRDRREAGETLVPVYRVLGLLILLNLLPWWFMQGHLAWQTHLGGFLAGALLALRLDTPD